MQTDPTPTPVVAVGHRRRQKQPHARGTPRFIAAGAALLAAALACMLVTAPGAGAGMVTGRVLYGDREVPAGTELAVYNNGMVLRVPAQKDGQFQIFLEPGIYRIECRLDGARWVAWLQSFRHNTQQEVTLQRVGP